MGEGQCGLGQAQCSWTASVDRTGTNFEYRGIGADFRLIESGLAPVIIARDEAAKTVLRRQRNPEVSPGAVARDLQPYVVQVPPAARRLLIQNGHASFEKEALFGDQFAVLESGNLYSADVGLLWEDNVEYLTLEESIL